MQSKEHLDTPNWGAEIRETFKLSWPLVLANLLQMAIYMVDVIFIARLGEAPLAASGLVAGLFGLFFPWLLDRPMPSWPVSFFSWPWIVFTVLGIWGLVAPMSLRPVYRIWMRFGLLLSKVMLKNGMVV